MNQRLGTGQLLGGRYRLDALIARGGMAEVWAATDRELERTVAIKVLHPHLADEASFRRRFRTEAVAIARLSHPNIVAIHDTCSDDGTDAIVMELVRGRTLRDYLDERGRLDPVEVAHIGAEVASGLTCAHDHGIVHRDVKPGNIMLTDDGRVLVTDFGIAKLLDSADVTGTATLVGTVKYLAPEQLEAGPIDGRADLYALGAVLYESLCGQPPFERDSPSATALARLVSDADPPSTRAPGLSPVLDPVLGRCLARNPEERYATAAELRVALLTVPADHPPLESSEPVRPSDTPLPEPRPVETAESTRRVSQEPGRRPSAIAAVALMIVALVVIALLVLSTDQGRDLFEGSIPDVSSTRGPIGPA
jgi:serine/threonine-protein kinase